MIDYHRIAREHYSGWTQSDLPYQLLLNREEVRLAQGDIRQAVANCEIIYDLLEVKI